MKISFFARIPLFPLDVRPDFKINGWSLYCQTSGCNTSTILSDAGKGAHFHWGPPSQRSQLDTQAHSEGANIDFTRFRFEGLIFGPDETPNSIYFARDPAGHTPIYFYLDKDHLLISTHILLFKKIGNVRLELNETGFIDFFLVGRRPFENLSTTPFRKIEQLQPGQKLRISKNSAGEVEHSLEDAFDYQLPRRQNRFFNSKASGSSSKLTKDYLEEFRVLFLRSVQRRSFKRNGVLVSGGLDSSSVFSALALDNGSSSPVGLTYSSAIFKEAEETEFVHSLEEKYQIPIHAMELRPTNSLMEDLKEQMRITELPIVDFQWSVTKEALTWFQSQSVENVLTGHWGDQVLFSDDYLIDLVQAGKWSLANKHLEEYRHWMSEEEWQYRKETLISGTLKAMVPSFFRGTIKTIYNTLKPDPLVTSKPYLSKKVLSHLKCSLNQLPSQNLSATHHSQSLYTQVRSKYATQCLDWNFKVGSHFGIWMRFPFLDPDLVQLLLNMPGEIQNLNGRPRGILREALHEILPVMIQNRTWKADFTAVTNSNVAGNIQTILQFLNEPLRLVDLELVDPQKFRNYVEHIRKTEPDLIGSNSSSRSWGLLEAVALEMWLREWEF